MFICDEYNNLRFVRHTQTANTEFVIILKRLNN